MAKRKRLTPPEIASQPAPETKSVSHPLGVQPVVSRRAPIAQVAGEASAQAALEEVAGELRNARTGGRLVLELPLDAVDETYLVRDRLETEGDELDALMESLRQRGQQTPIEVVELGQGRYGLISGWRRLAALRRLHQGGGAEAGAGAVLALLRQPETASDAYLAMVEENEIRTGLSFYERARIVAKAAEKRVYSNETAALKGLFGNIARARRSKIGSFLKLYKALDSRLRFPSAISERLGLALVKALEADPEFGPRLRDRLRKADVQSAADEVALLERALKPAARPAQAPKTVSEPGEKGEKRETEPSSEVAPGIRLQAEQGRLVLSGKGVDAALQRDLVAWLARR